MKIRLHADRRAPGAARSSITGWLATHTVPDGVHVGDVVLVASELVTNAVRAGAIRVDVSLRITSRQLDLLVEDDAPGWPTMVNTPMHQEADNGRGLSIVDQLTDNWTVTPRDEGKLVTAIWLTQASAIHGPVGDSDRSPAGT